MITMKRFVSVLLVAILVVACMSVAAFAAEAGDTVKVPVTVNGPVGNFKVQVKGTDVLSVVKIIKANGIVVNKEKGIVAWASEDNVDSFTFEVEVKIAADAQPGTHPLSVTVLDAAKKVGVENDTDGVADGWMKTSVSASGRVIIEAPATEPPTEEPTEAPTEPKPTEPKPTEPKPTEPKPTPAPAPGPNTGLIIGIVVAVVVVCAVVAFVLIKKRKG